MQQHERPSASGSNTISLAARRPLASSGIANTITASTGSPSKPSQISFDRRELNAILRVYGFNVAAGHWRDYSIDHLKDRAVFCVYRRANEAPLFRIEKVPARARRQGAYAVLNTAGTVLKRGHELTRVLAVLERRLQLVD